MAGQENIASSPPSCSAGNFQPSHPRLASPPPHRSSRLKCETCHTLTADKRESCDECPLASSSSWPILVITRKVKGPRGCSMSKPLSSALERDDSDAEELWSERTDDLRQEVRIPASSEVLAKPIAGKPRLCSTRNVSEGGLCLRWPQAPVKVDDVITLALVLSRDGVTSFTRAAGVVKWRSATEVGLAYMESPTKGRCR